MKTNGKTNGKASGKPMFRAREGWRFGKRVTEDVGAVIVELMREHRATPAALVEHARNKKSPAHAHFDWDDKRLADERRIEIAGSYLRGIIVEYEVISAKQANMPPVPPIRTQYPVFRQGSESRTYEHLGEIKHDADAMRQVLEAASRELVGWTERYDWLRKEAALTGVFREIDELRKRFKISEQEQVIARRSKRNGAQEAHA
jgi:uncharacterized protein with WD repeat